MTQILFNDGAAYERYMGIWSRLAGEAFIDWLAPATVGRWLDIGCGNGAFTELIFERCSPRSVKGIDPSEPQLSYARQRFSSRPVEFVKADAMALPFEDNTFDAAAMPLVIFFVPEPAKGVAEMARVVAPGGIVAAYAWDMPGGGFPYAVVRQELWDMGVKLATEPNPDASRSEVLRALWTSAGLEAVETREISVRRTFADFEDYWTTVLGGPAFSAVMKTMAPADIDRLKACVRARIPAGADGRIDLGARANAVKGRVPAPR
jgi:SAM-dependent methyltransferase